MNATIKKKNAYLKVAADNEGNYIYTYIVHVSSD